MTDPITELKPQPDDLVVVPLDMELHPPEGGFPFQVYAMKFLRSPSIVRSGGYSMGFMNSFANTSLGQFFGLKPQEELKSVRDEIFNHDEYGDKLRGDSSYGEGPRQDSLSGVVGIDGPEPESDYPPGEEPRIATMYITSMRAHNGMPDIVLPSSPVPLGTVKIVPEKKKGTSTEIAKFFRHVRAKELSRYPKFGTNGQPEWDLVYAPKGGVSFYIELDAANKTFAFSYALCNNTDNFDYTKARDICKGRFDHEIWYEVQNYNGDLSVVENIRTAIYNFLYNRDSDVQGLISFSSTPESGKVCLNDLKEIYKRT